MMNWLRNNKPIIERKAVEPGATFSAFQNHWAQAVHELKMESTDPKEKSEAALAVISHLTQMISLLRVARTEEPEQSCKIFWVQNKCSDQALNWLHELKNKGLQLSRDDDERLVMLLNALCELASRDGEILGYVRSNNELGATPWDGACSLASLLLEYSLGNDVTLGETARYSFILLIKLAARFPALEKSLSQENGIGYTNLVISGLSACFAQLPTYTQGTSEQMRPFIQQLKFVDDIAHAAPPKVSTALAECFSNSFLDAIIRPALTQDEGNRSLHKQHDPYVTSVYEEEAVVTRYLQTMCDLLTHPLLLQKIMKFVISLLQLTFLPRVNNPNVSVKVSTLSLFSSLLDFYCEDFWYHIILQHLLPQNHRMVSQKKTRIAEIDFHDSSVRFLSLIPSVVVEAVGPEALTQQYVQYLNNESKRLTSLETLGLGLLTSTTSAVPKDRDSESESTNFNPIYPRWKLKYDGTDDIAAVAVSDSSEADSPNIKLKARSSPSSPVLENGKDENGVESTESDSASSLLESGTFPDSRNMDASKSISISTSTPNEKGKTKISQDPLQTSDVADAAVFTNIPLSQTSASGLEDVSIIEATEQSFDSLGSGDSSNRNLNVARDRDDKSGQGRGYHSLGVGQNSTNTNFNGDRFTSNSLPNYESPSKSPGENRASFGPFLDCLLYQLANWTLLDTDVILMVTELLSLIAASRIPLVNSLLLDPTLILQPSYLSFASLLNRVRTELDRTLRNHPQVVFEVWNSMNKERRTSASSTTSSVLSNTSFDTESLSSLSSSIRQRMSSGANIAAKFQSLFSTGRSRAPSSHNSTLNDSQETVQQVGRHSYTYTNRNDSNYNQSPSQAGQSHSSPYPNPNDPVRLMAIRVIYFSHWLLELAAISQQLSWKNH